MEILDAQSVGARGEPCCNRSSAGARTARGDRGLLHREHAGAICGDSAEGSVLLLTATPIRRAAELILCPGAARCACVYVCVSD